MPLLFPETGFQTEQRTSEVRAGRDFGDFLLMVQGHPEAHGLRICPKPCWAGSSRPGQGSSPSPHPTPEFGTAAQLFASMALKPRVRPVEGRRSQGTEG